MKNSAITNLVETAKQYGGPSGWLIIAIISAAIAYGSSTATAKAQYDAVVLEQMQQNARIVALENDNINTGKAIVQMSQEIHDLWRDAGYRDKSTK